MTRECIHDIPRRECPYCKYIDALLTQNSMSYSRMMRLISGTQNRNITSTITRVSRLPDFPTMSVTITPEIRQAARDFINNPRNENIRSRFHDVIASRIARYDMNSPSPSRITTPSQSSGESPRSTSSISSYHRMGTPDTPLSRRTPGSANSNKSNTDRFSPPRKKYK
jgi:hypothetical protein